MPHFRWLSNIYCDKLERIHWWNPSTSRKLAITISSCFWNVSTKLMFKYSRTNVLNNVKQYGENLVSLTWARLCWIKPPKQCFICVHYDLVCQFAKQFFINTFIIHYPTAVNIPTTGTITKNMIWLRCDKATLVSLFKVHIVM